MTHSRAYKSTGSSTGAAVIPGAADRGASGLVGAGRERRIREHHQTVGIPVPPSCLPTFREFWMDRERGLRPPFLCLRGLNRRRLASASWGQRSPVGQMVLQRLLQQVAGQGCGRGVRFGCQLPQIAQATPADPQA